MEKEYKIKSVEMISPKYEMAKGLFNRTVEVLEIPEGTSEIKNTFMEGINTLKKVILPNSLIKIEYMSFYNCKNLETLEYKGTISEWNKINIGSSSFGYTAIKEVVCSDGIVPLEV